MSFITKMFSAGDSNASDAANSAAASENAIFEKLIGIAEQVTGQVRHADQQGLFDPERAAERFGQEFDRQNAGTREQSAAAMAHAGFKPGDSEVAYNDTKTKERLMQDELRGEEAARHQALQEKIAAYAYPSGLLGQASGVRAIGGQFGIQGGRLQQMADDGAFNKLAEIGGALSGKPGAPSTTGALPTEGSLGNLPRKKYGWGGFDFGDAAQGAY